MLLLMSSLGIFASQKTSVTATLLSILIRSGVPERIPQNTMQLYLKNNPLGTKRYQGQMLYLGGRMGKDLCDLCNPLINND